MSDTDELLWRLVSPFALRHRELLTLLLDAGDDINKTDHFGRTALNRATYEGHLMIVDQLVDERADVNQADQVGETPLFVAARGNHVEILKRLIRAGANVNPRQKDGETPLIRAASLGYLDIVKELLAGGAYVEAQSECGDRPLLAAIRHGRHDVAKILLEAKADANAEDKEGYRSIHLVLLAVRQEAQQVLKQQMLKALQELISHGAKWDAKCDAIEGQEEGPKAPNDVDMRWTREAPAIHVCVDTWMEETKQKRPPTYVPIEEIEKGAKATETYIKEIYASMTVTRRSKISVVGPGFWGKTSLLKSLTMMSPSLVHEAQRTIGIDLFEFGFERVLPESIELHEVTAWDYAGQDAYQGSHSLFFSARTVYLVCVDIGAYAIAHKQAELIADFESQSDRWLNEFIDAKILRWIRLIFACQPDATFRFAITKKDCVGFEDLNGNDGAMADLMKRLKDVMVIIEDMKDGLKRKVIDEDGTNAQHDPKLILYLGDKRLPHREDKPPVPMISSSCAAANDVAKLRADVEAMVVSSEQSFPMPEKYTRVLEALVRMKKEASTMAANTRIFATFMNIEKLVSKLQLEVVAPDTAVGDAPYLDEDTCLKILRTLHDLGDVLWFEKIGDPELESTVIIDPQLIIEFIRQIVTHKRTAETMSHATLQGSPFWQHLDEKRMLSMKRLLQRFQLVYPTHGQMRWDSDLLVPGYWKSQTSAFWVFGGADLRLTPGIQEEVVAVRVHWEIRFTNVFPDTLFDQLVVASSSPTRERGAGPDWIMYRDDEKWACRVVTSRDLDTHQSTLNLEAIVADNTMPLDEGPWDAFELLCKSLSIVLRKYPGLVVTKFARNRVGGRPNLCSLAEYTSQCKKWLPPKVCFEKCRDFLEKSP